jgi:phasin family protein
MLQCSILHRSICGFIDHIENIKESNMAQDVFESWNKLGQSSFEALKKLSEINLRVGEKLLQEQIELVNSIIETSSKSAEAASKAKGVQEVLSSQSAAAQECGKRLLKSCRSYADVLAGAREEYAKLAEKSLEEANKNISTAAEKKSA